MTDRIEVSESINCCEAAILRCAAIYKTDIVKDFGDVLCAQYTCKKCGTKWWHNIKEGLRLRAEITKDSPKPTLHTQVVNLQVLNDVCIEHKIMVERQPFMTLCDDTAEWLSHLEDEVTKPRSVSDRYRFLRIAAIAIAAVENLDSKI